MEVRAVGEKLVSLCNEKKNDEAIKQLYSNDIVTIEPMAMEGMPAEMRGIDAVWGKHDWWNKHNEVHSQSTEGPFVHGDQFAVVHQYDVTAKEGDRAGQRNQMREVAVYTVKDGKIAREEFFY